MCQMPLLCRESIPKSASLIDRSIGPQVVSKVDLKRTGDLLFRVEQHLFPLGDPPASAGDREQNREHGRREAHGLIDRSGMEVPVGIQIAGKEAVVLKRNA